MSPEPTAAAFVASCGDAAIHARVGQGGWRANRGFPAPPGGVPALHRKRRAGAVAGRRLGPCRPVHEGGDDPWSKILVETDTSASADLGAWADLGVGGPRRPGGRGAGEGERRRVAFRARVRPELLSRHDAADSRRVICALHRGHGERLNNVYVERKGRIERAPEGLFRGRRPSCT